VADLSPTAFKSSAVHRVVCLFLIVSIEKLINVIVKITRVVFLLFRVLVQQYIYIYSPVRYDQLSELNAIKQILSATDFSSELGRSNTEPASNRTCSSSVYLLVFNTKLINHRSCSSFSCFRNNCWRFIIFFFVEQKCYNN